jgi:hypothetical protein
MGALDDLYAEGSSVERSRKMKTMKSVNLILIAIFVIMGCSGNRGNLKTQSEGDSKVTQQELIDNWSDYHIRYRKFAIVFDPKNDDRRILLGGNTGWWWSAIKDQESWTEFVKENTTSQGDISPIGADFSMTGVREIWGPDSQLYGFIITQRMDTVSTRLVDENTLRLSYSRPSVAGP